MEYKFRHMRNIIVCAWILDSRIYYGTPQKGKMEFWIVESIMGHPKKERWTKKRTEEVIEKDNMYVLSANLL